MNYSLTSPLLAILFLTLSLGFVGIAYYLAKPKQKAKSSLPARKEKFENETIARELSQDNTTVDGLHPYAKKADNFRRRTGVNPSDLRQMFNNLFETAI